MEIWHLHPIFVHFTVALLFISSILFIFSAFARERNWVTGYLNAAIWMFWIGIILTLFTAISGLIAYFTVPDIDEVTRQAINKHAISAVITASIYLILAFFLWNYQKRKIFPNNLWISALVIAVLLLTYTAYLGGGLVYRYGVAVSKTTE
jgi:uncharacterized membrane protein